MTISEGRVKQVVDDARKQGKSVVFTNGCFDLFHAGHLHALQWAADQGGFLVVGMDSDVAVAREKGHDRPLVPQQYRQRMLEALRCVDVVVLFSDEMGLRMLVSWVRPDVMVKGAEWRGHHIVGSESIRDLRFVPELRSGLARTSTIAKRLGVK